MTQTQTKRYVDSKVHMQSIRPTVDQYGAVLALLEAVKDSGLHIQANEHGQLQITERINHTPIATAFAI